MKAPTVKVIVAIFLAVGVFAAYGAYVTWFHFSSWLGWPSLGLARFGIPHSWIASAILFVGGFTWLGFWSRKRAWSWVVIVSLTIPASYSVAGYWFVARAPIPVPAATPYDSTPAQRAAYLQAYDSGYRYGTLGALQSYCFSPEAETRGWYDGTYQGVVVWHRMFGRTMPDHIKRWFRGSAAIDGVRLESK